MEVGGCCGGSGECLPFIVSCLSGFLTFAPQYVLRVTLVPPIYLKGHVPGFRHDEVLEIATDCWGELDRDLRATGMPTPALGLVIHFMIVVCSMTLIYFT